MSQKIGGQLKLKKLICRVCQYSGADPEPIAYFDPAVIAMPLVASMLYPVADESPFPPRDPELPDTQWYYLRCPFCGGNPFGIPEITEEELDNLDYLEILTEGGPFIVGKPKIEEPETSIVAKRGPGRPVGSKSKKHKRHKK